MTLSLDFVDRVSLEPLRPRVSQQAIFQRDRELIAGGVLVMSVVFVVVNLLVDLTYAVFDPRVRLE